MPEYPNFMYRCKKFVGMQVWNVANQLTESRSCDGLVENHQSNSGDKDESER